jgi:formylglycine-generating enzyme required for sulfatase activity
MKWVANVNAESVEFHSPGSPRQRRTLGRREIATAPTLKGSHQKRLCRTAFLAAVELGLVLVIQPLTALAQDAPKSENAGSSQIITNSLGMKLAKIPAGRFLMGSPRTEVDRESEEAQHEVTISKPFYLGVYEVTQEQCQAVLGAKPRATFDSSRGGGPQHPMENITWPEAVDFCDKLSELAAEKAAARKYRLPTEAEWEYACRAGTNTAFHLGDSLSSQQANFNGNYPASSEKEAAKKGPYLRRTAAVGSFKPNGFGLYDMHGNVAEWCADWYDADYYAKSPEKDPPGPARGVAPDDYGSFYRVVRGGSWLDDAGACRSACRFRAMTTNSYRFIGFRVACEAAADAKKE